MNRKSQFNLLTKKTMISLILFAMIQMVLSFNISAKDFNLYDNSVKFETTEFSDKKISLDRFLNNYSLITIAYTECKSVCGFTIKNLISLENHLNEKYPLLKNKVNFIIITLDPETDNLKVLHQFKSNVAKDKKNWHFLRTNLIETRQLVGQIAMGFSKKSASGSHIMHSSKIALVNEKGVIIGVFQGPGYSKKEVSKLFKKLAK
jgi:protein SCO1